MATPGETAWMRGIVKAVLSGDCLQIMGSVKSGPPPEKTITLSSLIAPKLARRDGRDEPFAWAAREFLRKKCIGKEVIFKVDYKVDGIQREFGTVFLGDVNLALAVVAEGWAKVRPPSTQGPASPYISQLQPLEEEAKTQAVGIWTKDSAALAGAVRELPPSGVGQDSSFNAMELLEGNKGKSLPAVVEQVRDGSTVRVFLLPSFHYVQVYIAGIQCPSAGRKVLASADAADKPSESANGSAAAAPAANGSSAAPEPLDPPKPAGGPPSIAQRLAAGISAQSMADVAAEPYGLEAKHFTEVRCLNRDVRVVLEGVDGRHSNLVGSLYYPEGDTAVNIAPLLVKEGLAKVVEWSAESLEPAYKSQLKALELEAKKTRLRMWTGFVPPPSNSTAVRDDNFVGTVVEVVSGDCVVVADHAAPAGSPQAERRVNLSSIRARKVGNPRTEQKPEPYAREAKEFLRTRLIGQQVSVSMEYTRKITAGEGREPGPMEGRSMEFGTVLLQGANKQETAESGSTSQGGINVAEMAVARGFATVIRHRDFEERSLHYEALLAAEARAIKGKKGIHSSKEPPVAHLNDLSTQSATNKARGFLPFLQKARRMPAVVDYVLSGHRFKLIVPKEMCAIAFSLSGVRCPAKGEPYSEEAIAFMRRKILQHDVEIEVETVDKTGTFIGSLWVNRTNAGVLLLEAGLARLHPSFAADRTPESGLLLAAEKRAKDARTKVWESYVEGQEQIGVASLETTKKGKEEVLEVEVVHVLGGGRFYAVPTGGRLAALEAQLKELSLQDKPLAPGAFLPKKGDRVIAFFSGDNSWARGLVVTTPPADAAPSGTSEYEVFYIDYGNQEPVPLSRLRPIHPSVVSGDGLALYCQLALVRVPELEEDFGLEAAQFLGQSIVGKKYVARVEERDMSNPRVKGQGTGPLLHVTLVDPAPPEDGVPAISVNARLLQEGFARLVKRERRDNAEKRSAINNLSEHQEVARKGRLNMWQYGDIDDDDEEEGKANRWGAGRR